MNVGVCVPSTWHLQPTMNLRLSVTGTKETVTGPLSTAEMSYASPGHKAGVYVFRLYPPRTVASGAVANMPSLVEATGNAAISVLEGRGLPSDMKPEDQSARPRMGPRRAGHDGKRVREREHRDRGFRRGRRGGSRRRALHRGREDNAIAGDVPGDYAVVVTIVYGAAGSGLLRVRTP